MKRKLQLKSLLLTAALFVGANAWADSEIFSMTSVTGFSGTLGTDYVDDSDANVSDGCIGVKSGKTLDLTATFTGGTAKVKNGHGSKNNLTLNTSTGVLSIGNSSNSYLFITLSSTTIQEGDIITLSGYNSDTKSSFYISGTTSKGSVKHSFASSSYTVPAASALIGKASVYFWNDNGATISSITITRPQPATPNFDPADGASVAQGSKITVTSTYATTIQYKWTANSTTPDAGWTTYTNGAVVPEAAAGTPYLHVQCTRDGITGTTTAYAQYTITGADTDAPTLESTSPANSATGIAIAGDIVLTFNENVACTTNATLTPEGGDAIELTPVVSGTTVTYSYTGLAYLKAHTFALAANSVEDVSGNPYASTIGFSFTTAQEVCADPTFDVKAGYSFTIACATAGATIYYTVDDDDPKNSASKKEYTMTSPNRLGIKTSGEHTIYAYAVKAGAVTSEVVSKTITTPNNGDTYIAKPLSITLQPESATDTDTQYDGNTFTKNSFSLSSTGDLFKTSAFSDYGNANLTFKANSGTLTVTAPVGTTIQAIKVYIVKNKDNDYAQITVPSGFTRQSSSDRIISRYTYDYDSGVGMMAEHVISKDEPDNTCQFTIASQSRLYVEVYADVVPVDIKTTGTTFSSAYPIDCANLPEGVTAYKVTNMTASTVTAVEVTEAVAANTGLIFKATTAGSFNIPVAATGTDISATNLLQAAVTATAVDANTAYGLKDGKFVKLNAGNVPAGKAYLLATSIQAPELGIDFGGNVTGIENVNRETITNNRYFNLSGQHVAQPTKGLYIVNGKKVVLK